MEKEGTGHFPIAPMWVFNTIYKKNNKGVFFKIIYCYNVIKYWFEVIYFLSFLITHRVFAAILFILTIPSIGSIKIPPFLPTYSLHSPLSKARPRYL